MARLDAFSAQIVKFVRSLMTDEAILELVRGKLGVSEPAPITEPAAALTSQSAAPSVAKATPKPVEPAAPAKAAPAPKAAPVKATAAPTNDRSALLDKVERYVKSNTGVSASQVATAAGAPQSRVATALKELRTAKRIFQGGDRRFARYAGDAKTAARASVIARTTASGPILKAKPAKRGGKKSK